MKVHLNAFSLAIVSACSIANMASASITVTQQAGPAPTYGITLNFDEPGGPTGPNVPSNAWSSIGITSLVSGEGTNFVGDLSGDFPWLPNNNVYAAPFGAFINYGADLSAFSIQVWDPSGPPGPFGGGLGVLFFLDGVRKW
mgnify:FL=1